MSMYKVLTIVLAVFILGLLGYWFYTTQNTPQAPTAVSVTSPAPKVIEKVIETVTKKIVVTLQADKDSSESGTATLTEEGGKVKVVLSLTGAPSNVAQPAHIHLGKCPDVGAVKYPLTSALNGASETMLPVTFDDLQKGLPLAINVHKNVPESNIYVSCGNLLF